MYMHFDSAATRECMQVHHASPKANPRAVHPVCRTCCISEPGSDHALQRHSASSAIRCLQPLSTSIYGSPRRLAFKGRLGEALAVLKWVREENRSPVVLDETRQMAGCDNLTKRDGWSDQATQWIRRVFFIGICLGIVLQVVGVNSIMYSGTQTPTESGFGHQGELSANIVNGVILVLTTFGTIYLLSRAGYWPMRLFGATTSLLLFGLFLLTLVVTRGIDHSFFVSIVLGVLSLLSVRAYVPEASSRNQGIHRRVFQPEVRQGLICTELTRHPSWTSRRRHDSHATHLLLRPPLGLGRLGDALR